MLLVGALGLALSGGSFAVGTSYVSRWHSREQQGTALGIFGLGNIGTSLTHFLAPTALLALGWPGVLKIWALTLRSEEHTSELQSLMRISYAVFCLKNKTKQKNPIHNMQD